MANVQFGTIVLLALMYSGAVACTGSSSNGGGYGGQSNGGSNTGGTSATSGGSNTGGTSATSGGSNAGGTSATVVCEPAGTLTVTNDGTTAYVINGKSNPSLTLCRLRTYTFAINAPGNPFYIKTVQGTGTANAYDTGVVGNGATNRNITFTVATDAPDTLYYNCAIHAAMTGTIHIVD